MSFNCIITQKYVKFLKDLYVEIQIYMRIVIMLMNHESALIVSNLVDRKQQTWVIQF